MVTAVQPSGIVEGGAVTRGRFVVFEGPDGGGKSTQARRLATRRGAVSTREPGGTALGSALRALLLDTDVHIAETTEALLMAADRAQHVAEIVEPALAAGDDVVSDRHTGSSLAYQGHGRELGVEPIAALSAFATVGVRPDLVLLIDVDPGVRAIRSGADPDRLEAESRAFHERVRAGYLALAAADPTWAVIDGAGSIDEVATRVDAIVAERLGW